MELDISRKFDFHLIVMTTDKMVPLLSADFFSKANKYERQSIEILLVNIQI